MEDPKIILETLPEEALEAAYCGECGAGNIFAPCADDCEGLPAVAGNLR